MVVGNSGGEIGGRVFSIYNRNPIELVHFCLMDKGRTLAFKDAIFNSVSKGDVVVDIGTGSGIMALFAAEAGAKRVYAVEIHPFMANVARRNFEINGYENVIEIVRADALNVYIPKMDIITAELLTSGLVEELQGPIINDLHRKGSITEKTKLIPYLFDSYAELVHTNFNMYGFDIETIRYEWPWYNYDEDMWHGSDTQQMSDSVLFSSVDFRGQFKEIVNEEISFKANENGVINTLRIKSITHLTEDVKHGVSGAFCAPVLIPIPERNVRKGERIGMKLRYRMGAGYENLRLTYL